MRRSAGWTVTAAALAALAGGAAGSELDAGFADPPRVARLRAYWWWLNGNVTKEAVTRDLEWMRQVGMGGALVFDAGGPAGPTPTGPLFGSPEWRALFTHAVREADRLGLELTLSPQSGWNLGGPPVEPEEATKHVAWSELRVSGPAPSAGPLPVPKHRDDFYRDTFVLAYRLRDGAAGAAARPEASAGSAQAGHAAALVADGDPATFWVSRGAQPGEGPSAQRPEWLQLAFPQPVTLGGLRVVPRAGYGPREGECQVSADGKAFEKVQAFAQKDDGPFTIRFPATAARAVRLLVRDAFDPRQAQAARNVQVAELEPLDADGRPLAAGRRARPIRQLESKAVFHELGGSAPDCTPLLEDVPAEPGEEDVAAKDVLDLTGKLAPDGTLRWEVPAGAWQVLRFGYTNNGARVSTSSGAWKGRVVDYLDAEALRSYWRRVVEPLLADLGPLAGRAMAGFETDSWEAGGVNWSAGLPDEFRKRRGYDLRPWLPVLAGRIVEGRDASNRFLADFRKTIGDCMADNHYAVMADLARRRGMRIHCEASGPHAGPFDGLKNLGRCDWPMGEFWVPSPHRPTEDARFFMKMAATAAHVYGRPVACGEGFTSIGPHWDDVLWSSQKPTFDHEACAGLNLVFWHAFTCSPPEMGVPGQQYFAGTHFDPQITWSRQARAFVAYLNRCQFLLQQGLFVADVCHYAGDHVPCVVPRKQADPARVLPGYDYDVVNEEVLLTRMSVKDGRIVLPDGMSYRLLSLPPIRTMSLAAIRKIRDLVEAGATVVGPKPERTASLTDYPACDAELQRIAAALWDAGRVQAGRTAREALAALGVPPDFESPAEAGLDYIHRRAGEADLYFVSNPRPQPVAADCTFRVAGRRPELWDPVSGAARPASAFRQAGGRTTLPLDLAPCGSVFVVFRAPIPADAAGPAARNAPALAPLRELGGPWTVSFDARWGGPAQPVAFERLEDWTKRPEEGIRFYSGTATYRKAFDWTPAAGAADRKIAVFLDLGVVKEMAEVRLNGRPLGVVWCPPWRVEITGVLKPGANDLEIDVVNLWPNRLIGDGALPPEKRLTKTNVPKFYAPPKQGGAHALMPSGLLGPVTLQSAAGGEGDR